MRGRLCLLLVSSLVLLAPGCGALPADPTVALRRASTVHAEAASPPALLPVVTTSTTAALPPPGAPASAGRDLGSFEATCYDLRGRTASGVPAGPGSIAADPAVIPLGTRLVVGGYGAGVADDTGGAIRGRRVDVWLPSAGACAAWGRRWVDIRLAG